MKVLLVTPSYGPIVGGTESFVQKLAIELNASGVSADVMTLNMNEKWNPFFWQEVNETDRFKVFKIPALNPFRFLRIHPVDWVTGTKVIPKPNFVTMFKRYDIIHFCDEGDLSLPLFSIFYRKPRIMHCLTPIAFESIRKNFFQRRIFRKIADFYILSSQTQVRFFTGIGVPLCKLSTFPSSCGVDTVTFKPNNTKKLDDLILFVGRLQRIKGAHILLKALSYVKIPTQVVIIGPADKNDPEYAERITQMSHSINEKGFHKVKLLGGLKENEIVPWYQRATILARPDLEGVSGGLTSLEALACGTPVVGTGNDVVKNGVNGILVPPRNCEKLANAIQTLLEDKSLREQYGKEGRSIIELQFSFNSLVERLTDIYEELLTNYSKRQKLSI